jgi:hypothetical protein
MKEKALKKWDFFSDFSLSSCFGTYLSCFRTSFPVLERPFPVSERHFPVLERPFSVLEHLFPGFLGGDFVPGRPETEEFVLGHLLLPLSRDKGTPGQEFFFVPGQRDNGTSRPLETLVGGPLLYHSVEGAQHTLVNNFQINSLFHQLSQNMTTDFWLDCSSFYKFFHNFFQIQTLN